MRSSSQLNAVLLEVADLVDDLHRRALDDEDLFSDLTRNAAKFVPGAEFAGITVIREHAVESIGATDYQAAAIDEIQRMRKQGPCLSAAWDNHVIRVDDLGRDDRWPRFRDDALATTTIRSILSVRLFGDAKVTGALNFYAASTHVFDDDSVELAVVFATHTALVWDMVRRNEQFQSALASRDIIGQAKGMIMERFNITAVDAFELLKRLSQDSNTPLAELARQLVNTEHPPQ